jgi:hypothetical protein
LFLVNAPGQEEAVEEDSQGADDEDEAERPKKTRKMFRTREEELHAEDEETAKLIKSRETGAAKDGQVEDLEEADPFDVQYGDDSEKVHLNHIRDYEPHDETSRKDQELVFTFISGDKEGFNAEVDRGLLPPAVHFERSFRNQQTPTASRASNGVKPSAKNVVYYHPVSARASLRVRRRRVSVLAGSRRLLTRVYIHTSTICCCSGE